MALDGCVYFHPSTSILAILNDMGHAKSRNLDSATRNKCTYKNAQEYFIHSYMTLLGSLKHAVIY